MESKTGYFKRNMVYIGIPSRLTIFFLPFFSKVFGKFDEQIPAWFSPTDRGILVCLLLPVTCLYLSLFLNFVRQNLNNYLWQGRKLNVLDAGLGYAILVVLHITEFSIIVAKGYNLIDNFFIYIGVIEAIFAFYGLYLFKLFNNWEAKSSDKKPGNPGGQPV